MTGTEGPQWNAPTPSPPAKKNRAWIPLAAAGAVFVLVLGALGAWWAFKGNDSSNQSTPPSTTSAKTPETTRSRTPKTTEAVQADSPDSKLLAALPDDYATGVCKPASAPEGALATVDCGKTIDPNGPEATRYSLFADQATLDTYFNTALTQNYEPVNCPGDLGSPSTWSYNQTPDQRAGRVACGTYDGHPDVMWTKDADLLLADAQGSSTLRELHQWWLKFG